ncbi:MAG TPA: type II CAAX endopeptidase family protein [Terriglobia bacterium]|nr:type II CAAX endopeptidase family protein [Terriglobia bacterium]
MIGEFLRALFVVILVVAVPVMSYSTARKPEVRTLPRRALYFSATLSQWLLAIVGIAVALAARIDFRALGFRGAGFLPSLGWTVGLTLASSAGLLLVILLERRGWWPPESELVYLLLPETRREKVWCVLLLAPTAGLCEEFLYRGFLLFQIANWTHSSGWGLAISSIAFGLAHTYQGVNGMARAAFLGALLALPVVRLGTLYPSMASHFLIDALALVWLGPKLLGSSRRDPDVASGKFGE